MTWTRPRRLGPSIAAALIITLTSCGAASAPSTASALGSGSHWPSKEAVVIEAADGHVLDGRAWHAPRPGPAVLLLHQCDLDRRMYDDLGARFAAGGIHALAFSLRGIGGSASPAFDRDRQPGREFWPRAEAWFPDDAEAALRRLHQLPGVDPDRIGVLGASCMGREVVRLATDEQWSASIRAAGFLSTRLDPAYVQSLARRGSDLPMLWITAEGDRGAAVAARAGARLAEHPASAIHVFPGRAHGAPLFDEVPGLEDEIVRWFRAQLAR